MKEINAKYLTDFTDDEVRKEVEQGIQLLTHIKEPLITFLGSHVGEPGDTHFDIAYNSAKELGKIGYGIMTGGGPGVMLAGNKGAKEAGRTSIGITEYLIKGEPVADQYMTHRMDMKYMFVRRFILSIKSQALVVFPGGFGTLNEMFEFITVMQVNMVDRVPVILVNRGFWKGLTTWMETLPPKEMIRKEDLDLVQYADTVEEIIEIIKKN